MSTEQPTSEQMFRVNHAESIESVEVVKKTKCFVTFIAEAWHGKKYEARESAEKFFPTWQEAHASLVADYEKRIKWKKEETHRLESRLGQIRKMQP